VLGLGAIVLVGAAVAAVVLSGNADGGATPSASTGIRPATLTGRALPAFTDPAADPAIGQAIPEASGTSFEGTPVRITADGRAKLLLFLAHWCPHCQAEVPVVQAWLDATRLPRDVDLISVATSSDPRRPNYPPDAWLTREGWTAPVLADPDDSVARHFGLGAFPYWVAVTAEGSVAMRFTGELTPAQLDALAALVAG
jgi:thiol-disulfide isomerase/thioredoxin